MAQEWQMARPRKTTRTPQYPALSAITAAAVLCACGGQEVTEPARDRENPGAEVGTGGTPQFGSGGSGVTWGTPLAAYVRGGAASALGDGGATWGVGGAMAAGGATAGVSGRTSTVGGYGNPVGAGASSYVRGGASNAGAGSAGMAGNGLVLAGSAGEAPIAGHAGTAGDMP